LWAKDGHAFWKTKMIIPAISASTMQATAPRIRSTLASVQMAAARH
jgi:hypothetical protein